MNGTNDHLVNVTEVLQRYRHLVLSIWNQGLWREPVLRQSRTWHYFKDVQKLLFNAMVVEQLADLHGVVDSSPDLPAQWPLFVVPKGKGPIPAMISQPGPNGEMGRWDAPVQRVSSTGTCFRFIEYFDWNQDDYLDFQYYRTTVQIRRQRA